MMSSLPGEKSHAKKAHAYFRGAQRDEAAASQILKDERAADAAKMAKLRHLRLEKEAADKLAAEGGTEPTKPAQEKPAARKRPATTRITY
jgi:hypothetical protein